MCNSALTFEKYGSYFSDPDIHQLMNALKPVIKVCAPTVTQVAFSIGDNVCQYETPILYCSRRAVCVALGAPVGALILEAIERPPESRNVSSPAVLPLAVIDCSGWRTFAMILERQLVPVNNA